MPWSFVGSSESQSEMQSPGRGCARLLNGLYELATVAARQASFESGKSRSPSVRPHARLKNAMIEIPLAAASSAGTAVGRRDQGGWDHSPAARVLLHGSGKFWVVTDVRALF